MFGAEWWLHGLLGGALASLASSAVLVLTLFHSPYAYLHDHPADIREAALPASRAQRRAALIGGTAFMLVLLVSVTLVPALWKARHPEAGFLELAAMALLVNVMFAIADTALIDAVLICRITPRGILIPGTEDCAGWRDAGHHVRAMLAPKALAMLVVLSLVTGGLALWLG